MADSIADPSQGAPKLAHPDDTSSTVTEMEPIDALERATEAYEQRLVAVDPRQWGQPSACDGWSVKDLADHVLGGNRFAVALLSGATADDAFAYAFEGGFDADAVALTRDSADAQLEVFALPGALDRTVHHPVGDIDGATFLRLRLSDLLLHGWDLALSVGGDESMDDELVAIVWDTYRSLGDLFQTGAFGAGPSGTLESDAPLAVRLLDLTGRRPKR